MPSDVWIFWRCWYCGAHNWRRSVACWLCNRTREPSEPT